MTDCLRSERLLWQNQNTAISSQSQGFFKYFQCDGQEVTCICWCDDLQVKNIYVHTEMFSIQNGLLTPTLKAKRPELKEFFKEQIEQLYSSISM